MIKKNVKLENVTITDTVRRELKTMSYEHSGRYIEILCIMADNDGKIDPQTFADVSGSYEAIIGLFERKDGYYYKKKSFLFNPKEFFKETKGWASEEVGRYITLICQDTETEGKIPEDLFKKEAGNYKKVLEKFRERNGYFSLIK